MYSVPIFSQKPVTKLDVTMFILGGHRFSLLSKKGANHVDRPLCNWVDRLLASFHALALLQRWRVDSLHMQAKKSWVGSGNVAVVLYIV